MVKIKILMVEDDETAASLLQDFLNDSGFSVDAVFTTMDGISHLKNKKYDILLLDINLPDFDGFDLLSNIKKTIAVPTIVISAYNDTDTIVKAFKYGASDYVTKPIKFKELEARIWALLSRNENIKLEDDNVLFKIEKNQIVFKESILTLTALEFDILSFFINNKDQVVSRERLSSSIASVKSHRLLDNHIKNIRKKIEDDSSKPTYLKTEYGIGYTFTY